MLHTEGAAGTKAAKAAIRSGIAGAQGHRLNVYQDPCVAELQVLLHTSISQPLYLSLTTSLSTSLYLSLSSLCLPFQLTLLLPTTAAVPLRPSAHFELHFASLPQRVA